MTNVDIEALNSRLLSEDIERAVNALKETEVLLESLLQTAVRGLGTSSNKPIFADYLTRLGPALIPYLEEFYAAQAKGGSNNHCASPAAFWLTNRIGRGHGGVNCR